MSAFDAAFDASFDSGGTSTPPPDTGYVTLGLQIAVINPNVFLSAPGGLRWVPVVMLDGSDISDRLSGQIKISAAEDSARIATLSYQPLLASDLTSLAGQEITIGVSLDRAGALAYYQLFAGTVERAPLDMTSHTVTLSCRDGYQARIAACQSAAEVEALFGGLAFPAQKLYSWNATDPDPVSYFSTLLDSMAGAVSIDSTGLWQAIPWSIGTPSAIFGAGDVFDDSVSISPTWPADLPGTFTATLKHRHPRLHQIERAVTWSRLTFTDFVVHGTNWATKAAVQQALSGISEWQVKGEINVVSPTPGTYPVIVGPATITYIVSYENAPFLADSVNCTLYRRWYQNVETSYTYTITLTGGSDRTETINEALSSDFDGAEWETTPTAEADIGIWASNAPTVAVPPTGYEGLLPPHPGANGGSDYWADIVQADIDAATTHMVGKVVRKVARALRNRTVSFSRPIDPRWEIGSVLAISAQGVSATGQVIDLEHMLDIDSGDTETSIVLAVPESAGSSTAITASAVAPTGVVAHIGTPVALANHVGGRADTPRTPDPDTLIGFLCNVLPTAGSYDPTAPTYQEQFRVIMPAISQSHRDALEQAGTISATWSIAGGSLAITF